jgi:hypothetical protein
MLPLCGGRANPYTDYARLTPAVEVLKVPPRYLHQTSKALTNLGTRSLGCDAEQFCSNEHSADQIGEPKVGPA